MNGIEGSRMLTLREGKERFGVMLKKLVTLAIVYVKLVRLYMIDEKAGVILNELLTLKV